MISCFSSLTCQRCMEQQINGKSVRKHKKAQTLQSHLANANEGGNRWKLKTLFGWKREWQGYWKVKGFTFISIKYLQRAKFILKTLVYYSANVTKQSYTNNYQLTRNHYIYGLIHRLFDSALWAPSLIFCQKLPGLCQDIINKNVLI